MIKLDEYKNEKIKELNQRNDDGIIISNNLKALTELINLAKSKEQVDLIFEWGSQNPETGYYFEKQIENYRDTARYLTKVDQINGGGVNKLIIGDNYDALNNLLITHKGKIDIIYIDPPYGMDNAGNFAKTNYENKLNRDSLLSMLEPRIQIAKQLMSDDGIFFCSIDDKNYAYVKLLCDKIFGEVNFISSMIWIKKRGPGGNTSLSYKIVRNTEYVLVYSVNPNISLNFLLHSDEKLRKLGYIYKDSYFKERGLYKLTPLFRPSSTGSFQYAESLDYEIKAPDNTYFKLHCNKNGEKKGCYTWSKQTYIEGEKLGFIEVKKNNDGDWVAYRKQYQFVKFDPKTHKIIKMSAGQQYENLIDEIYSSQGGNEIVKIFGDKNVFDFPKPVELIKYLINIATKSDSIILDFFAGSGTTGQAVLELNKEDEGNRKFILCVNEDGGSDKICKERLLRVMTGKGSNGEKFEWIKNNKPLGGKLNVYEIKQATTIAADPNSLIEKINEEDYDHPKFGSKLKKIEWIAENFKVTTKTLTK